MPFEKVLDLFVKAKMEEAQRIEQNRKDILSDWQEIAVSEAPDQSAKFTVIEGKYIYSRLKQMIEETINGMSIVSTFSSLLRAEQNGLLDDAVNHASKTKTNFRFLTELSDENLQNVKRFLARTKKAGTNFEGKTPELGLKLPARMMIKDDSEAAFFMSKAENRIAMEVDDVCLWTNCRTLVESFKTVFENLWQSSTDIKQRITEIETGKYASKTCIINDAVAAKRKYDEAIKAAREEIALLTSSERIIENWRNMKQLKETAARGVSIKVLAPITNYNLEAIPELSKFCEIRHFSMSYLRTTIIDNRQLFQFKNPSPDREKHDIKSFFENTFYTNDVEYVKKTKNLWNQIWENACQPSSITLESIAKPPMTTFFPVPEEEHGLTRKESPYQKILLKIEEKQEVGALSEKDVLNKIFNAKRTPAKDPSKDIVKLYGSEAGAFIHTPGNFNLPDLLIAVFHCNKHSSFGPEDWFQVQLLLETPTGAAFLPVAIVGDNEEGLNWRKTSFAGTPAAANSHLLRGDELEVEVHGNDLFAGWTVPIPLLPPQYTLPPAALLFESYSKLKTVTTEMNMPSGTRIITEGNGFDAFVTFFHPASRYAAPGTDGVFVRDMIMTVHPPYKAQLRSSSK